MGSCDPKMDNPMNLVRKPLTPQKIAISFSTGAVNGFASVAIDIYHITLHF